MSADIKIEVRGIRELAVAFRHFDAELPKNLRAKFLTIAQRIVGIAQSRMEFGPGKAMSSVKARASASGASIAFGGQAAPYYPWLDFGGTVGRGHRPGQRFSGSVSREWLGTPYGEGRYVYPAISEARPETEAAVDAAIKESATEAGFEFR